MTKKDLSEYKYLVWRQERLENEIAHIKDIMYGIKSPNLEGHFGSGPDDRTTDLINKEIELENLLIEQKALVLAKRTEIEKSFSKLDGVEYKIMELRYIDGLPFEKICCEVNYEWAQVHRYHAKALDKVLNDTK